jgi:hypothetical protein
MVIKMDYRIQADLDLQAAKNLRDAYSCTFPYEIGTLQKPQELAAFYDNITKPLTPFYKTSDGEYQFEHRYARPFVIEAADLITNHQDAVLEEAQNYLPGLARWSTAFRGRRSGIQPHGNNPHCDYLLSNGSTLPSIGSVTSLVANSDTTISVPHKHTLNVLSASRFSHILNQPFTINTIPATDPEHWIQVLRNIFNWQKANCDDEKRRQYEAVSRDLWSETVQYFPNTVFRMASQTIHIQPPRLPIKRVCVAGVMEYIPAPV